MTAFEVISRCSSDDCLIFPEHALAGARCIHEDFIEEAREDVCKACRCLIGDKHVFTSEQLQIAQQCFGAGVADVIGDEKAGSFQARIQLGCLAARCGAEIEHTLTRFDREAGRRGHGAWLLQIEDACRIQWRLAHAYAVRHEIAVWNPRNFLPRSRNKRREIFGPAFFCIHTQPGCAGCVVGS